MNFPFGHQGLYYDAELESYQNRHRQYDPTQMRFLQRDPLGLGFGLDMELGFNKHRHGAVGCSKHRHGAVGLTKHRHGAVGFSKHRHGRVSAQAPQNTRYAAAGHQAGLNAYAYAAARPTAARPTTVSQRSGWKGCYECTAHVDDPAPDPLSWFTDCYVGCHLIKCYTRDENGEPNCDTNHDWIERQFCDGDCTQHSGRWMIQKNTWDSEYLRSRLLSQTPGGGYVCEP